MQIVPISRVLVQDRQRTAMSDVKLRELKTSIQTKGLAHAPMVRRDGDDYILVVGERRLTAITALSEEGVSIVYDGTTIPPGSIPVTILVSSDPILIREVELEENLHREDLSWQDRVAALAEIHKLRSERNPEKDTFGRPVQTPTKTAKELAASGGVGGLTSEKRISVHIGRAMVISKHLSDPTIQNARTEDEAYQLIVKKGEEQVLAELNRRRIKAGKNADDIILRLGSAFDILPQLDEGQFSLILTDPPYGIDAGSKGFRRRTVHHHNYEDTSDVAKASLELIFSEGFRLCAPTANLFVFCDIDYFVWAKECASRFGWDVFRTPIIWRKSKSEGLAPWQSQGPRRTTELILYARKGRRGLYSSPVDVLEFNRVPSSSRVYGAQKPVDLLKYLIEVSTIAGDKVLDPFMGSGSTLRAARLASRKGLGLDSFEEAYSIAMTHVFKDEEAKPTDPEGATTDEDLLDDND